MKGIAKSMVLASFVVVFVVMILAEFRDAGAVTARKSEEKKRAGRRAQNVPTFSKEVVRIFQKNCQTCHHPGDIAPFSMMTWQETRPWAKSIREQVLMRKMPPWKPVAGCGDFRDARVLSEEEIQTIVAWVDGGSPEGDPADLPAPLEFPDGWPLGTPDLVVVNDVAYSPPVQGDMYRCYSVPVTGLRGDRWVGALSVKPGNPRIVHHVIAYPDTTGVSAQLDAADPEPGYTCFGGPGFSTDLMGGWAPGSRGYFAPEGTGIPLRDNSRVVIQVHYHPTGEAETDLTQVGLYFSKTPVTKRLQVLPLVNTTFAIPPGAKDYDVTATYDVLPFLSAKIWALTPHMHLLGRRIKVDLTRPGENATCLINVDDWDFNWQGTYLYKQGIPVPGGSKIRLTATYDNSTDNPFNPNNPPKTVRWGEETTDEMALAFVGFTLDFETFPLSTPALGEVSVDATGNLLVKGSGFLPGADIEINGHSLRDTAAQTATLSTTLTSVELWKVQAAPGEQVDVTVINPDGVRTSPKPFIRAGQAGPLATVSAANYSPESVAPESIVAAFGNGLASGLIVADTIPLPTTLGGATVRVNGLPAPLFFVSPGQINFLAPAGTLTGNAVVEVQNGSTVSRGSVSLVSMSPAIFTSNAQGTGAPAAVATRDGINYVTVGNPDGSSNGVDPQDFLVLFGTGFRRASISTVRITIGGIDAPVLYAGPQGSFTGLDQINTQIPPGLKGLVEVVVSINGNPGNRVSLLVR
ncbi:MAG: c-type cytochrome [Acidobacteriota bacterium]|nr:MAG: c-type cytochrome [Acidobacteriota bacterium]